MVDKGRKGERWSAWRSCDKIGGKEQSRKSAPVNGSDPRAGKHTSTDFGEMFPEIDFNDHFQAGEGPPLMMSSLAPSW